MAQVPGPWFHGSAADLRPGDLIVPGHPSPYGSGRPRAWVYLTTLIEGAVLAAEIAAGDGRPRVYQVEPTGPLEDDPNVTDKKLPGNPARSYRSQMPFRVIAEVTDWTRTAPERLAALRAFVARTRAEGIEPID
jgi:hypothetical protein